MDVLNISYILYNHYKVALTIRTNNVVTFKADISKQLKKLILNKLLQFDFYQKYFNIFSKHIITNVYKILIALY